jgi:hypothetical protein
LNSVNYIVYNNFIFFALNDCKCAVNCFIGSIKVSRNYYGSCCVEILVVFAVGHVN